MPEPFQPRVDHSATPAPGALVFAFHEGRLAVEETPDGFQVPDFERLHPVLSGDALFLGTLAGRDCFVAGLAATDAVDGLALYGLRELFGRLPDHVASIAGRAAQMLEWSLAHAYCGRCGSATEPAAGEIARVCPNCGALHFPRITPAVIMLVERDARILLARNRNFRGPFYSVLAGFVEPGETLEEAVAREVREEVGIEVDEIRYFGSQAWPFPSQLMIGFTARHSSGELSLQQSEILEAGWYGPDEMPALPGPYSIARKLIESFLARQRGA